MVSDYNLLGIKKNSTQSEIKSAFKKKLLEVHPDHNSTRKDWANEETKKVIEAYKRLSESTAKEDISNIFDEHGLSSKDEIMKEFFQTNIGMLCGFYGLEQERAKKDPSEHYWVGYSFGGKISKDLTNGNEYVLRGFRTYQEAENFKFNILPGAVGRVYTFEIKPKDNQESSFRGCACQILVGGNDTPEKIAFRNTSRKIHTLLSKISKVHPYDEQKMRADLSSILADGFNWFESSAGELFVACNAKATFRVKEIDPHENGVYYGVEGDKSYGGETMFSNFDYSGFNIFFSHHPLVGIIKDDGKPVGIYVEEHKYGPTLEDKCGWRYQEFGTHKRVLLKPDYI